MQKNNSVTTKTESTNLDNAHGPIPFRMTNDYLFRALMQTDTESLRGLICSLLHLRSEDLCSAVILNPIELGKSIDDKNFILDIKVELNANSILNLEMQVINEGNWPERSLSYLCRAFDNLGKGQKYETVRPAIQIGLLDFTLFEDTPEFYATYFFMNEKNYRIYSDKLRLSVVDLTKINLATEEDRLYKIDHWAALFKTTTWEELKMLAKSNPSIKNAASTVYKLTQEEKIRQQLEAREDYYRRTAGREELLQEKIAEVAKKDAIIAEKDAEIADKDAEIAKKNAELEQLRQCIAKLKQK